MGQNIENNFGVLSELFSWYPLMLVKSPQIVWRMGTWKFCELVAVTWWQALSQLIASIYPNTLVKNTYEVYPRMSQNFHQMSQHDVIKWKHFPCYWPFVQGNHQSLVNSPHKGQWHGALMFLWSVPWINGWVNNREADDLRCHRVLHSLWHHCYEEMQNGCCITRAWIKHVLKTNSAAFIKSTGYQEGSPPGPHSWSRRAFVICSNPMCELGVLFIFATTTTHFVFVWLVWLYLHCCYPRWEGKHCWIDVDWIWIRHIYVRSTSDQNQSKGFTLR